MSETRLRAEKAKMRALAIRRRRDAYRTAHNAPQRLCRNFLESLETRDGMVVSGFWPMGEEIDVRPLLIALHDRGAICGLPATGRRGTPLAFRRWQPGDELISGTFGTHEPSASSEIVNPSVLIVPMLAFDAKGWRLGYGGGYYDRTLCALRSAGPIVAVGVAFAGQEVDDVPHGEADEPLDWIVTEEIARRVCGADRHKA